MDCNLWDGKCLSHFIKVRLNKDLGVRQAQRLLNDLDFHFRKPRPMMVGGDPDLKDAFNKNHADDE
ncbi:MAG: winged helix-turn-helix domain-containing protein [Methanomassiliicoccales archaeon]